MKDKQSKASKRKMNAEISHALMSDMERVEWFLATYWRPIAGLGIAAAIAVTLFFWGKSFAEAGQREGNYVLADAKTVEALNAALAKHGSNPGAPFARYRLAQLKIAAKDYAGARQELEAVAKDKPAEPLYGQALLGVAYLYELENNLESAAARFDEIGRTAGLASNVTAEADANAGRVYLALKKLDEAANVLRRIGTDAYQPDRQSTANWCDMARSLLLALENGEYGPYKPAAAAQK